MKKSTIEKLKELMKEGKITRERIKFMQTILDDEECPILLDTNIDSFIEECETYVFESIDSKTKIEKEVIPIYGNIEYSSHTYNCDSFIERKGKPYIIDQPSIIYIEERKVIHNKLTTQQQTLDKKILIFLGSTYIINNQEQSNVMLLYR